MVRSAPEIRRRESYHGNPFLHQEHQNNPREISGTHHTTPGIRADEVSPLLQKHRMPSRMNPLRGKYHHHRRERAEVQPLHPERLLEYQGILSRYRDSRSHELKGSSSSVYGTAEMTRRLHHRLPCRPSCPKRFGILMERKREYDLHRCYPRAGLGQLLREP